MHPLSLLTSDCTRTLDSAIARERVRYASEHNDFHQFFKLETVAEIQRVLRGEPPKDPRTRKRGALVTALLYAQKKSPHDLWRMLLVQANEAELVRRRRALGADEDPELDGFVLQSFVGALDYLPAWLLRSELETQVLEGSEALLTLALEGE